MQLLLLISLLVSQALAGWRPIPGVPANRLLTRFSSNSTECPYEPYTMECNETQSYCDSGYYNNGSCWNGNYCVDEIQSWDGCPGVCSTNCNWETEDFCSYEYDSDGCWMGNWCQDKSLGGCPEPEDESEITSMGSGAESFTGSGSSACYEPYTQECNATELYCDSGISPEGCWHGNYCLQQIQEWDGGPGVCATNCNWETEDWCSYDYDSDGCWMGNWCQDKSLGGCPEPTSGSGIDNTGFGSAACYDPYVQTCNDTEISCDSGMSLEGCWYGNYCILKEWEGCPGVCSTPCNPDTELYCDSGSSPEGCWYGNHCIQKVYEWDGCPGVCGANCNWETEDLCDQGTDTDGCWLGNWCQDKAMGGCPNITSEFSTEFPEHPSGSGCHEPFYQECNDTEIWCDSGSSPDGCWHGNYCIPKMTPDGCPGVCSTMCNWETEMFCDSGSTPDGCWNGNTCIEHINSYSECPGVCPQHCNPDTEDWCDLGTDEQGCWYGNYCQEKSLGGCPESLDGSGIKGMGSGPESFANTGSETGSGFESCPEYYTETCNATKMSCDAGYSPEGCWWGNYCIDVVDIVGCPGICPASCNYKLEETCDMGYDDDHCWLGNYCLDRAEGECPNHHGDSGFYDYSTPTGSGSEPCPEFYSQDCNATELYCDSGVDFNGCWMGNYCILEMAGNCPGICHMPCTNYEVWCDNGYDAEGCWQGNHCMPEGSICPDANIGSMMPGETPLPTTTDAAVIKGKGKGKRKGKGKGKGKRKGKGKNKGKGKGKKTTTAPPAAGK